MVSLRLHLPALLRRPHLVRKEILYLNGVWQWEAASRDQDLPSPPFNTTLSGTILVPFLSRLYDWLLR